MSNEQNEASSEKRKRPRNNNRNGRPRRRRGSHEGKRRSQQARQSNWTPADFQVPVVEGKARFHDFSLPDVLMHAVADLGFEYCTPIQAETIPAALEGKDLIGKAQTGTGKTAAFLMGIITDLIDYPLEERSLREPRALIIAPTRELALQIASDAIGLCKYANLSVVSLVGGMDYEGQRKELAAGPVDILVATPGRLLDFVKNKDIDLYNVEVLVLDEADRMLSMGFIPDVRSIIRETPRKGTDRQTLLYSATFTDEVMNLARQWTLDPVTIEIANERKTTDSVSQTVFLVSSSEKYKLLKNYIRINNVEKVIVFCNRRHEARKLAENLQKDGIKAALMSGEIPQQKRVRTLEDFRDGKILALIATDVAGRGIHVDGVSHVVNYQLPEDSDDYVHRIGRTGRAGTTGTSICFACENDSFLIPEVEAETGVKLICVHPDAELLADTPKAASKEATKEEAKDEAKEELKDAPQEAVTEAVEAAEAAQPAQEPAQEASDESSKEAPKEATKEG
ncbi:MAG: ATP-dependent RNA helicase RhlB [Pontibacterium sp.]